MFCQINVNFEPKQSRYDDVNDHFDSVAVYNGPCEKIM